jgi:hypothetical protein
MFSLILFLLLGGTVYKFVMDVKSIANGTYVKRKAKQYAWKKVRKYRK